MVKKRKNRTKRQIFAPLQAHEDKQRAFWFCVGAATVLIIFAIFR